MKFITVETLLPYKGQHAAVRKRLNKLEAQKWQPINEDCSIEGITFKQGSLYKAFETTNFGWLVFHPDSRTIDGSVPGKRIFRW